MELVAIGIFLFSKYFDKCSRGSRRVWLEIQNFFSKSPSASQCCWTDCRYVISDRNTGRFFKPSLYSAISSGVRVIILSQCWFADGLCDRFNDVARARSDARSQIFNNRRQFLETPHVLPLLLHATRCKCGNDIRGNAS